MSLLLNSSLISSAISQIANIEQQIVDENNRLLDLQSFAANISDGNISMEDMMNSPASMFNRTSIFMQQSNAIAMTQAQQKMAYTMRLPGAMPQVNDPRAQQMYMNAMLKSFYDQGKQEIVRIEQKKLNVEETKIQQRLASLETRKKSLEKLLESAKSGQDASIQRLFAKG